MSNDNTEFNEVVDITLWIKGEFWDKRPMYKITVNDDELVGPTEFDLDSGKTKEVQVRASFPADQEAEAVLKLYLLNKEPSDTKKDQYDDPDNFNIVADMLLTLSELEIDGIKLPIGSNFQSDSDEVGYYLLDEPVDYNGNPNTTKIQGCNTMGWNGAYCFEFKVPVYMWILGQFK